MSERRADMNYSLYLVTDREMAGERRLADIVLDAVRGGVTVVQLREKTLETGDFLRTAIELKETLALLDIPLIINDRIDIALAMQADGVHLGQKDMPLDLARNILGDDYIIGVSVSSIEEAIEAERGGADYIAISPIWSTPSKTDTPPEVGIDGAREICRAVSIPVVGIGGIKYNNVKQVICAGCGGAAVISAIMSAQNPREAAQKLREAIIDKEKSCL